MSENFFRYNIFHKKFAARALDGLKYRPRSCGAFVLRYLKLGIKLEKNARARKALTKAERPAKLKFSVDFHPLD
jgi:hypothetical protein